MINYIILGFILNLVSTETAVSQTTFDFIFTDASGLSDTITLGVDSAATNGLDAGLGEINIKDSAVDSFDVRFIGLGYDVNRRAYIQTWASKKQFVKPSCIQEGVKSMPWYSIGIYTEHWPVTLTWDSVQFTGVCPRGGGITAYLSDGISSSNLWPTRFDTASSVTFTSHGRASSNYFALGDSSGGVDTAEVFYLTLETELQFGLGIQPHNRFLQPKKSSRWLGPWLIDGHDFLGRRLNIPVP
jgi:hypothetical protein